MASKQPHERRRLQKSPRGKKFQGNLYSCQGIAEVVQQSYLAKIDNCKDELMEVDHQAEGRNGYEHHVEFFFAEKNQNSSSDSLSMYSAVETQNEPRKRVRAKTPIHFIGQLERNSMIQQCDRAMDLAEEYQSQLPPRAYTPFCEEEIPRHPPHRLRKIKCQLSLRDLVREDQYDSRPRISTAYSDAETLVGSEPSSSLPSPIVEKTRRMEMAPHHVTEQYQQVVAEMDHNIGLKICADLLTNELASALYRHHPVEVDERASGLQILLMIEAYESVQQHVRQMLYDAHATGGDEKHMKMVDEILEHWLQVLYSVYDRAQEKNDAAKLLLSDGLPPVMAELRLQDGR